MLCLLPLPWFTSHSLSFYFFVFGNNTLLRVPRPGIELMPSAVKMQSLNHWNPKEYPIALVLDSPYFSLSCFQFPKSAPPPPSYAFNPSSFQTSVFLNHQISLV